jgi:hypothetical protein
VPCARLHTEIRGSGPVLLMIVGGSHGVFIGHPAAFAAGLDTLLRGRVPGPGL